MERLYCPHCGAGYFATDTICLNCNKTLREVAPPPAPVIPTETTYSESEQDRRLARIFKIGGGIVLGLAGLWFYRLFGPCALIMVFAFALLVWLWEYNDTRKEEERGRRILAAGGDKAAVQAELARYHLDEPRMVQTRYGLYEVSAFDSRLGRDTSRDKDGDG
jgi:hypothetical protein